MSIVNGFKSDVVKHVCTSKHKAFDSTLRSVQPMSAYFDENGKVDKVTRMWVLYSFYNIEHWRECISALPIPIRNKFLNKKHNIPITCTDHTEAFFKGMFPSSKIASKYACA